MPRKGAGGYGRTSDDRRDDSHCRKTSIRCPALAGELGLAPRARRRGGRAARRGQHGAVHRALPQGATGGLDEVQIRAIEEQRAYLVELEERRAAILASIDEQGKLTPELEAQAARRDRKAELEDLYLPYKPAPQRAPRSRARRGLEPLAERILAQPPTATRRRGRGVRRPRRRSPTSTPRSPARATSSPRRSPRPPRCARRAPRVRRARRARRRRSCRARSDEPTKFEQYYDFEEPVADDPVAPLPRDPPRRGRGRAARARRASTRERVAAGILRLVEARSRRRRGPAQLAARGRRRAEAPARAERRERRARRAQAALRREAVDVFADNLRKLLLAAPLGARAVIGLDPGLRTGCKCVAVDATGKFLGTITVYLVAGRRAARAGEATTSLAFVRKHEPRAIAVGNGTGGRETEAFVREMLAEAGAAGDASSSCRSARRARASTRRATSRARSSPSSTSRCAARSRSRAACRIRSPSS